jgi:hypothetical protein
MFPDSDPGLASGGLMNIKWAIDAVHTAIFWC